MKKYLISVALIVLAIFAINKSSTPAKPNIKVLAARSMSLEKRYAVPSVSDVMRDNILLNLAYLKGDMKPGQSVDWSKVRAQFSYDMTLKQGETFAFHDEIAASYKDKVVRTTNAHFSSYEGFKSDGWLVGDGVCHLASLIYWAAKDAGLATDRPVRHDFAVIPQIPADYGVSIYNTPNNPEAGAQQNLYITNNKKAPITFRFTYDGENLKVSVVNLERSLALSSNF